MDDNVLWLDKQLNIGLWWNYYNGVHRKMLKARHGIDDNLTVNLVRLAVDKVVSYLFGKGLHFEVGAEGMDEQDAYLVDVWGANRQSLLLQQVGTSGAVAGHVFLKILEGDPPRLINLDPSVIQVGVNPDDYTEVRAFRMEWLSRDSSGEKIKRIQVIARENEQAWSITDSVQRVDAPNQATVVNQVVWKYPFAPIVHCQNLPRPFEFYGVSDVEQLIALQDTVNFTVSNIGKILRLHGHPKTIGSGFTAKELQTSPDEMFILPSPDAKVYNLEMQSDLSSSIEFYKRLIEAWHEIARIPTVSAGNLDNVGSLSGVALRILYEPLIELVESKRETYGAMLVELNQNLLAMRFGGAPGDYSVRVVWSELLPRNMTEEAQVALLKQQIGVSQETLLRELGYDPELEARRRNVTSTDAADQLLVAMERRAVQ
jgi:hypothetical protein